MFDIEQIMKGYEKEDEFIARDLILIELLVKKEILNLDEIKEAYSKLADKIEEVKSTRRENALNKCAEIERELEELKNGSKEL